MISDSSFKFHSNLPEAIGLQCILYSVNLCSHRMLSRVYFNDITRALRCRKPRVTRLIFKPLFVIKNTNEFRVTGPLGW